MAIPDINHKVCIICDYYTEDDCPYCGMGFEGFSIEKHDMEVKSKISQKIRVNVIDECIRFVDEWDSVIADALSKNMKEQIE